MRLVQTVWLLILVCGGLWASGCKRTHPPKGSTTSAPDLSAEPDVGPSPDAAEQVDAGPPPHVFVRKAIDAAFEYARAFPENFDEAIDEAQIHVIIAAATAFYDGPHQPRSAKLADQQPEKVGEAITLDDGRVQLQLKVGRDTIQFEPFQPHFEERCDPIPTANTGRPRGPARTIKAWENPVTWFRFDGDEASTYWLVFGQDELTVWVHDEERDCALSMPASAVLTRVEDAGHEPEEFPASYPSGIGELAFPGAFGLQPGKAKYTAKWTPNDDPVDERTDVLDRRGKERVRLGHDALGLFDRKGKPILVHKPEQEWEDDKIPCGDATLSVYTAGDTTYVRLRGTYGEETCTGEKELWWRFDSLVQVTDDTVEPLYSWAAGSGGWTYEGSAAETIELRLPSGNGHLRLRRNERSHSGDGEGVLGTDEFVEQREGRTRWAFELEDRTIRLADLKYDIDTSEYVPYGAHE